MTADEIREYVLTVHAPLAREESIREDGDPDWFRATCDSTCAALAEALGPRLAPFRVVEWGSFRLGSVHDSHCWLVSPDGTIVDPTSRQFGLDDCVIARPGDGLHGCYTGGSLA